jgi:hypothetical protein
VAAVPHVKAGPAFYPELFRGQGRRFGGRALKPLLAGKKDPVKGTAQGRTLPIPDMHHIGVADQGGFVSPFPKVPEEGEVFSSTPLIALRIRSIRASAAGVSGCGP